MRKLMSVHKSASSEYHHTTFQLRAASALTISLIGDLLDYIAAPIFDVPLVGDIFDVILSSHRFRITRSKISTAIPTLLYVPFVGELITTYTLSTVVCTISEWTDVERRRQYTVIYK